jgi:hypothetical protein
VQGGGSGWVEVDVFEPSKPGESTEALRARTMEQARRAAVEKVTGTEIHQRFFGTGEGRTLQNHRVAEHLAQLLSDALLLDEQILAAGREGAGCRVRLRARVALRGARADPGYAVRASLSKAELTEGDEVEVRVRVTRDSYLYLFSVGADGDVTVLVPNRYLDVPLVRAGSELVFPGPLLHGRGIRIRARLPAGARESFEQVKAIALRRPIPLLRRPTGGQIFESHEGSRSLFLTSILKELAGLDPDEWCDGTLRYSIRGK